MSSLSSSWEKSGYFYRFYRFVRPRRCHRKYAAKNFLESYVAIIAVFAIMGFCDTIFDEFKQRE